MIKLKGLKFYLYNLFSGLESGDLKPGSATEISTKLRQLLEGEHPYWTTPQVPPKYNNWIAIEPISENGYGLEIYILPSNQNIRMIVHDGVEFGKLQNIKLDRNFRIIDFHLDHELLANLLLNLVRKCISNNHGDEVSFEDL
ncbi:hypothetical protein ACES2I_08740 [Bdellovibrio bacteriovorus]|uniref:hypothetical protein n=1 Tax=Bdellovibrio bacteriovorus TaxID=959 RepID=UPI0035A720A1